MQQMENNINIYSELCFLPAMRVQHSQSFSFCFGPHQLLQVNISALICHYLTVSVCLQTVIQEVPVFFIVIATSIKLIIIFNLMRLSTLFHVQQNLT